MRRLYLKEQGINVGIDGGRLVIKKNNLIIEDFPKNTIEAITIFGNVNLSVNCMRFLMENHIPTIFLNTNGKFVGKLSSCDDTHRIDLIQSQVNLCDSNENGIFLNDNGKDKFIRKYEDKLCSNIRYLSESDEESSMRDIIYKQCKSFKECIRIGDTDIYEPIRIR